jgi:hypothetical protein
VTLNRSLLFLIVAVVCLVVGFLLSINVFDGREDPWLFGGLLAFAAAHIP